MQNAIIKAQIGLARCEQSLQQLFLVIHMFGHQDEGGFDDITLDSVRGIIDSMRREFKTTNQLLDRSLGLEDGPPPPSPHTAIIKQFRQAS